MSTAAPNDRLAGLDLLRAIAIVWVMLFHSYLVGGLGPDWRWLERFGWMGVDLFFVLSGYLIGRQVLTPLAHGQRLDFLGFYLRRAFRILPALWMVLALYLAFPALRERPGLEPAWKFFLFVYNFGADYGNPAFSQVWSLCVEEHFYLLFPLLATMLVPKLRRTGALCLCATLVVAGIGLRGGVWIADAKAAQVAEVARNWFIEDLYYPTWNRLDGLLAGVILATLQVFRADRWNRWRRHANAGLAVGTVLVGSAMWLFRERSGLIGNTLGWPVLSAGMALLVFAGAGRDSLLGCCRVPAAGWLAQVSYSLYLIHKIAFGLVDRWLGGALQGHVLLAVTSYACASLLAGAALHYAVERPGLRLRDYCSRRRSRVAAPA